MSPNCSSNLERFVTQRSRSCVWNHHWSSQYHKRRRTCQSGLTSRAKNTIHRPNSRLEEDRATQPSDPAANLDLDQFPFPRQRPRFQPFIGESETKRALESYRHRVKTADGEILIRPMSQEDVPATTDLLASTFADAVGYMPMYRGILVREVREYLQSHVKIAPKAVILVMHLKIPSKQDDEDDDQSYGDIESTDPDSNQSGMTWFEEQEDASSSPQVRVGGSEQPSNPLQPSGAFASQLSSSLRSSEPDFGSREASGRSEPQRSEGSASVTSSDEKLVDPEGKLRSLDIPAGSIDGLSSFSAEKADRLRGGPQAEEMADESSEGSSLGEGPQASPSWEFRRSQDLSRRKTKEGEFVGTVELSFSATTRTRSLTLNPPPEAAYLCNMAISPEHQRRGFGYLLLCAAEEVVQLAGFRRVYLHVRLEDLPARGLYRKAGFEKEAEDCFLVSFWNHRRQLQSKFIPRKRSAPVQESDPVPLETVPSEF